MVPIASAVATLEPHRREQRARHHGDEAERTPDAAEPGGRDIDQRLGDAAGAHEGRRHHEQRQRHKGRRVELVDHHLRRADQRLAGVDVQNAGAHPEHQEDRHSRGEQPEEQQQK
jgi:hypothetical protein